MKALVVFTSIRANQNFGKYAHNFTACNQTPDIIVIDETPVNRNIIKPQLKDFNAEFYGAEEISSWFNSRGLRSFKTVIPERAHNKNSFGLLIALERGGYDMIVFLDDDTYPVAGCDFLGAHYQALNVKLPVRRSEGVWMNTHPQYYAHGMPYCQRRKKTTWGIPNGFTGTVLNMGLWTGIPDLNAIDYLALAPEWNPHLNVESFTVAPKQFAPICGMNVAFKPEIIPAYYQLWHKGWDDLFGGLYVKVIADHMGKGISVGKPLCVHAKEPRDLFKDIETELPSMRLNEELWKVLLSAEFTESTWLGCYRELAAHLKAKAKHLSPHYVTVQTEKMNMWCELTEKIEVSF